jgi:hypothetical protein
MRAFVNCATGSSRVSDRIDEVESGRFAPEKLLKHAGTVP